jgi:hypothetical protein
VSAVLCLNHSNPPWSIYHAKSEVRIAYRPLGHASRPFHVLPGRRAVRAGAAPTLLVPLRLRLLLPQTASQDRMLRLVVLSG